MTDPATGPAHAPDGSTFALTDGVESLDVGRYRLLTKIGEGGMGEVWLAQQTTPISRRVALKVIKAGMDTAQVVARFEAERQALALMDHPNVAHVFDAGATLQGRPYFVMEYVPGLSITAYCDTRGLDNNQRIRLFISVCEAVQHAHQKGIIHRDLKPSNILVAEIDDQPHPKIIDFGIAKATSSRLTARTLYTECGVLMGTLEYMSPEQADLTSLDVDTRSDVYALGVVLYELLTGTLPFDTAGWRAQGVDEIRRVIRDTRIAKPSSRVRALAHGTDEAAMRRRTDSRRLVAQLRGDLDLILMKALAKERAQRYGGASEFAADLQRHLANEPILAVRPSARYTALKFATRHRMAVAASSILLLLLLLFAASVLVQTAQIRKERDRANREAATARQITDFMTNIFAVSDPSESRGQTLTAREVLQRGAQSIDTTLAEQPDLQSRLQLTIGRVYTNLGLYAEAEPILRRSVQIGERTRGVQDPETVAALSMLADVLWYEEQYAEAETLYRQVLSRRQDAFGREHPDTLRAQFDLASVYLQQSRWPEAEQLQRDTLDSQRRVLGAEHIDTLKSLSNLGVLYYREAKYVDAQQILSELVNVQRRTLGSDHPSTLISIGNLANVHYHLQQFDLAERL